MIRSNSQKGFTLIEALVAIFILSIAIVGPLQVAYQGVAATTYAKNKLIAQYLAQGAAEFLQARHDENPNTTDSDGWLASFSACKSASGCMVNTDNTGAFASTDVQVCPSGVCPILQFNSTTGQYGQNKTGGSWANTNFVRKIQLTPLAHTGTDPIVETQAIITVSWSSGLAGGKSFVLRYNYFNNSVDATP